MKISKVLFITTVSALLLTSCHNGTGDGHPAAAGISASAGSGTSADRSTDGKPANLVEINEDKPAIKLLSKGSILPSTGNTDLLFGSINYAKAQVRIKRIFKSNILQFMQFDSYETRYNLYRVAKQIADTTIVLGDANSSHIREYRTYGLSLDEIVKPEPGAIYHVEIRGREPLFEEDFWDSDYYFGDYETYGQRSVDLLASDIALLAKGGDNGYDVFVFNIITGKPVAGAKVKLFDFVQQELSKGTSDRDGRVHFDAADDASFVVATSGENYAYLGIRNEKALSTSNFDVGGTIHEGGIKAYIFGERGVWRPGDTLHVSAVTMLEDGELPDGYPVVAELRNPDGQVTQTITVKNDGNPIYHFPFVTQADAPTGRWSVNLTLGGRTFSKALRVETVKPNRMDIGLTFNQDILTPQTSCIGTIAVNWLYGAVGKDLKVEGELELSSASTSFKGWEGYDFQDEGRSFESQTLHYYNMRTGEDGTTRINTGLDINRQTAPGMLNAAFTLKAFEESGEFSTSYSSFKLSPFNTYVGIRTELDKDSWGDGFIKAGQPHKFDIATVDAAGKGVSSNDIRVEICHVDWSWWWNSSSDIASYMSGSSKEVVFDTRVSTTQGKGSFTYNWDNDPSGLYFIRVSDSRGGHSASMLCEVYENYSAETSSDAAAKLNIKLNKDSFNVGETARVTIPSSAGSNALISVEKGGKVLSIKRVDCYAGSTEIQIPVTSAMTPNAYVHITLIQPHNRTLNDAPIRLYGVRNISVEDEGSHLHPQIDIPSEVKPESTVKFKVKEENGRAMSYVVALVDEGLLSLTGFKTPDAWKSFYAKEALRVRTWDAYDNIIGAYGGRIEQLFAIGGDDEAAGPIRRRKADRFTPVVAYLGPYTLKAGKSASHSVAIPQYIGSLRAMVIATDGKAQGSTQKNVNVTKPVMIQATLPRTLSTGEHIRVPATLISLNDNVGNVRLSIKADGMFSITGPSTINVKSSEAGQQTEYFELQAGDKVGIGHVSVTASSASDSSTHDIEIDILNPNPEQTRLQTVLLDAGQSKDITAELFGIEGTNSLDVELSSIPAINLNGRLKYLLEYPYGCIEQTISAAFPQLYLGKVMECDERTLERSSRNVEAAIRRMQSFRRSDGSLSYWPGGTTASSFGSAYALHFLQEAENCGYAVPADLKNALVSYLAGKVVNNSKEEYIVRTYGLYALAASGKPQRSAMNNLREVAGKMPNNAVWMLAGAFAADGKKPVAQKLTAGLPYTESDSRDYYYGFGSEERNKAIALKSLLLSGQNDAAFKLAADIAGMLNDKSHYMSTQTTAWCLYSICDYARTVSGGGINAVVNYGSGNVKVSTASSIANRSLKVGDKERKVGVKVSNNGTTPLYAVVAATGIPAAGEEKAVCSNLKMSVSYSEDISSLERSTGFKVTVTVTNTGSAAVHDIALAQKFPSGWEIRNDRIYKESVSYPAGITYQDFRDDRVYTFFDLGAGQSVSITTGLTAAYPGHFYLPAVSCEAMYDQSVSALEPGRWVDVK